MYRLVRRQSAGQSVRLVTQLTTLIALFGLSLSSSPTIGSDGAFSEEGRWASGFHLAGPDGRVACTVEYQGDLIVGGDFQWVGGEPIRNLARWDGERWTPLGDPDGRVEQLAVVGSMLYVSGEFREIGGSPNYQFASWDGGLWRRIERPAHYYRGYLFADGSSVLGLAHSVADPGSVAPVRWDGSTWNEFGGGYWDGISFAAYANDVIWASGVTLADSVDAIHSLASWNGDRWVDSGVRGLQIADFTFDGPRVWVAGDSLTTATQSLGGIAFRDADHWRSADPADGLLGGDLEFVAGVIWRLAYRPVGDGAYRQLVSWDGAAWIGPATPVSGHRLTRNGAHLLVYESSGGRANLVEWNDGIGKALGESGRGIAAPATAAVRYEDGVAVAQASIAGVSSAGVLVWREDRFADTGFPDSYSVSALCVGPDDALFAADWPSYDSAVAEQRVRISKRTETGWETLDSSLVGSVEALAWYDGRLVAGGSLRSSDDTSEGLVQNALVLEPHGWEPLGGGVSGWVSNLVVVDEQLFVAGKLESVAGRWVRGVAAWNGQTWSDLDRGLLRWGDSPAYIRSIASHEGGVLVSGELERVSSPSRAGVAIWTGRTWLHTPDLTDRPARVNVGTYRGSIVASVGVGAEQTSLNWLDVDTWEAWPPYGDGHREYGIRHDRLVETDAGLFFFGRFRHVGRVQRAPSAFVALWEGAPPSGPAPTSNPPELRVWPNPTAVGGALSFAIEAPGPVRVTLHDLQGRLLSTIVDRSVPAGTLTAFWPSPTDRTLALAAGVYFIRCQQAGAVTTRRAVILR